MGAEAVEAIYGHGANCLKDVWYDGGAGDVRSMADTRSKQEHQTKRKRMAHIFSQKNISGLEPLIAERVQCLFQEVTKAAEAAAPINIRRYVNYFTIDVITQVMFGEPARCLENGSDMVPARSAGGHTYTAPLIGSLHDSMRMTVPIGYMPGIHGIRKTILKFHPLARSAKKFDDIVRHFVTEGLARMEQSDEEGRTQPGFLSQIEHDKTGQRHHLPFGELQAECSGMINAGSDTTSTALANSIYLLFQPKHHDILRRLREELAPVFEDSATTVPSYDRLARLPFLRACIDETMRLRPSSAFGLPREVPAGGRTIAGEFVAGGVSVSVPTYSLLHDKDVFHDPDAYRPSRWTDLPPESSALAAMKTYHLPFSTGPRACIGRNIAYFEMTLVVAVLVHHFDFAFADEKVVQHYRVLERLNANPDELVLFPSRIR